MTRAGTGKEDRQVPSLRRQLEKLKELIEKRVYASRDYYSYYFRGWYSERLYILASIYGETSRQTSRFEKAGELPSGTATSAQWVRYRRNVMIRTAAELEAILSSSAKPVQQTLGRRKTTKRRALAPSTRNQVFVVHGRNEALRKSMFDFIRALGLDPIEWDQAIALTKKASPYIGEILDAAFRHAQAIVVLATGDDEARLAEEFVKQEDPRYESDLMPQPRPNVLFEAGLAMGRSQDQTLLVEVGNLRPWSDIAGRHITHLDNSADKRKELARKLETAGCVVDLSGHDWIDAGDFGEPATDSPTKELPACEIADSAPARLKSNDEAGHTFSGTGPSDTRLFRIASSPWKLRYTANWSGHFAVQVRGTSIDLIVNRGVTAKKTYETYVHGQTGHLYLSIQAAPPDGEWTLLVITGEKQ